jgi:hypothetical protein
MEPVTTAAIAKYGIPIAMSLGSSLLGRKGQKEAQKEQEAALAAQRQAASFSPQAAGGMAQPQQYGQPSIPQTLMQDNLFQELMGKGVTKLLS